MEEYKVQWSFSINTKPEERSTVTVYAYDEQEALSKASKMVNNPLAFMFKPVQA